MSERYVLALTQSQNAADMIVLAAREDFRSVQTQVRLVPGYGPCIEVSVDADEYKRWIRR